MDDFLDYQRSLLQLSQPSPTTYLQFLLPLYFDLVPSVGVKRQEQVKEFPLCAWLVSLTSVQ